MNNIIDEEINKLIGRQEEKKENIKDTLIL